MTQEQLEQRIRRVIAHNFGLPTHEPKPLTEREMEYVRLLAALADDSILAALADDSTSAPPSPHELSAPNPDLPRNRGKVAAVDGLTTVGEEAPR